MASAPSTGVHLGACFARFDNTTRFPGHMRKVLDELKDKVKLAEVVVDVRDARVSPTYT